MISHLRGTLQRKSPTEIVIDVDGVGYLVNISVATYEKLGDLKSQITVLTYLHVREDAMQLYGFLTEAERQLFRLLISVSGIGPKMAQSILSGLTIEELREAIVTANVLLLTSISGVGRKTAERIVLELRSKVGGDDTEPDIPSSGTPSSNQLKARSEALVALMSLGHSRQSAEDALRAALKNPASKSLTVEELIKQALLHTRKSH